MDTRYSQELLDEVNDRLIQAFQRGIEPFRRPFDPAPAAGRPANIISRNVYSGVNALLLDLHCIEHGFRSRWYGTKKDWRKYDASVVAETGCRIVHGGQYVTVFNAEQTVGADRFLVPKWSWRHIPDFGRAQRLIEATGADIRYGFDRCFYLPPVTPRMFVSDIKGDYIELPDRHWFIYEQDFFHVAFHELAHWCEPRIGWADGEEMSELQAEITACCLARSLGIPPWEGELDYEEHTTQIQSWLDVFREDD